MSACRHTRFRRKHAPHVKAIRYICVECEEAVLLSELQIEQSQISPEEMARSAITQGGEIRVRYVFGPTVCAAHQWSAWTPKPWGHRLTTTAGAPNEWRRCEVCGATELRPRQEPEAGS